jgi:hypothetical protein
MVVGSGPSRNSGETNWNSSWQTVPPNAGPVAFTGFTASSQPQDIIKRWGTNNLVNANSVSNIFNQVLSPTTGVVALVTGDGYTRDVASLVASFDQNVGSPSYESQVVGGDSGSGVFYKNGTQWNLVGIADAQFIYKDQPGLTAMYGDLTTYIDLAYYHDQIFNIINAHKNYSISGDINLDGNLCGDGSPACGSSDVAAFVAGWGYNNHTGAGNIASWKKGDLNFDGKVDVADFLLLRSAFNASGSGASLNSLNALLMEAGKGGVPEPDSIALAAIGAALLAALSRRRSAILAR